VELAQHQQQVMEIKAAMAVILYFLQLRQLVAAAVEVLQLQEEMAVQAVAAVMITTPLERELQVQFKEIMAALVALTLTQQLAVVVAVVEALVVRALLEQMGKVEMVVLV